MVNLETIFFGIRVMACSCLLFCFQSAKYLSLYHILIIVNVFELIEQNHLRRDRYRVYDCSYNITLA